MLTVITSNFAGIIGPLAMIADTELDQWRKVLEVNTVGVWICNKYELRQMIKQSSVEVFVPLKATFAVPSLDC